MLTKYPGLMQGLFLKKLLKINNLYMHGMFRCELFNYEARLAFRNYGRDLTRSRPRVRKDRR